jgi:epsilon-lactone hydrolase
MKVRFVLQAPLVACLTAAVLCHLPAATAHAAQDPGASGSALPPLQLPARAVPVPTTISPAAQQFLASGAPKAPPSPPANDKSAWRAAQAAYDAALAQRTASVRDAFAGKIEARELGGARAYEITPDDISPRSANRAILYLHAGDFVYGAGLAGVSGAVTLAAAGHFKVFAVDYRMPPDHPYPAALDDAVAVFREVIKRYAPANVALVGVAAGGDLAAAAVLKLRDSGQPLPGAAVLLSPETDLAEAGDSLQTNRDIDIVMPQPRPETVALYAGDDNRMDPYLSPVYGDFSRGYCPTFLQSGTRDLLLSDTVRLHRALRRAGIEAELHVFEAMPHLGFAGAPEDDELLNEELHYLDRRLGRY